MGGSDDLDNLRAVCPKCNAFLGPNPSEFQFTQFLFGLMEDSEEFVNVTMDARLATDPPSVVDLCAERISDHRRVLIECKTLGGVSLQRLPILIDQLQRYQKSLDGEKVIVAYPGKAAAQVEVELKEMGVEVWDIDRISNIFNDQIKKSNDSYYVSLFLRAISKRRPEVDLINKLKKCPPGVENWSVYQKLIGRILNILFCPPLSLSLSESSDFEKVNRRDFIFPNYASDKFWSAMRQRYGADYIVVDAKNKKGNVTKENILQISNYMKPHGVGLFGIIVARNGVNRSAEITMREQWIMNAKMIVVLTDSDLESMLLMKMSEDDPSTIIADRIQQFRIKI